MFSYLRPHRRTPSNPTSPDPNQSHAWEPSQPSDHAHPQRYQDSPSQDSPILDSPPSLPPITRVSSTGYDPGAENRNERAGGYRRDPRTQTGEPLRGAYGGGDTNGLSNPLRMPAAEQQRPESAGAAPVKYSRFQNTSRPQANFTHERPSRQPPPLSLDQALPFVTAADLQGRPAPIGKRPTGARLPTPPSGSNPVSSFEPTQPRSGKARLNLLNPLSLLARRRTSQAVVQLSAESLAADRAKDFDPRIRGTVVHDFSAPRGPRRNQSYNDVPAAEHAKIVQSPYQRSSPHSVEVKQDENSAIPWSGGEHTPVFTEDFEEEQYPAAGPHVRKATDLSDLPLPTLPYAKGASRPVDPISPSGNQESKQNQSTLPRKISAKKSSPELGPPVAPKVEEEVSHPTRISIDPAATPPKSTAGSKKGRSRNVSEASISGLPKHMKSTSSRFSFDMIGAAKQEKLLEDRHRQKALEKKNEEIDNPDEEVEFDYDDMMDDDGLEERIPGVNADLEEEEEDLEGILEEDDGFEEKIPDINADEVADEEPHDGGNQLGGFTFHQSSLNSPMSPYGPGAASTPRDDKGNVIGFAYTKYSPQAPETQASSVSTPISSDARISALGPVQGLGLLGVDTSNPTEVQHLDIFDNSIPDFPQANEVDDDDLYFDDGIIDDFGEGEDTGTFDESVFDNVDTDQYGRPLKAFTSLSTLYSPPTLVTNLSPSFDKISEADENNLKSPEVIDSAVSPVTIPAVGALAPKPSIIGHHSTAAGPSQVLTQDTLAAYQSALAAAAYAAAANGKFNRRDSTATDALSPSSQTEVQPGLIPDSSHTSHYETFSSSYELEDDFDYDDELEDDTIIAAANAEALANDCDGFYGQEFGFYSAPAAGEAEYANGGYFGPRGAEGINRSQSGRVAAREPNLTPITERSEYSNRNSMMHGPNSAISPGLAQLAGMLSSSDYEGDLSLNALLKLRRGAWGGSQASLHSSPGSPRSAGGVDDISPVGGGAVTMLDNSGMRHRRQNSGFSIGAVSEIDIGAQSEVSSRPESPTLTTAGAFRQKQNSVSPEIESMSSRERDTHSQSPEKRENGMGKEFRKHKHSRSSESISYLKETDPTSPTGDRWVLERKITAENGEVEFLGREVVSGGRI